MATKAPGLGTGLARSFLGQGVGMGWGDEGEAWLREKLGEGDYESLVEQIRAENAAFGKENPWTSGVAEFSGAMAPSLAMMLVPGLQPLAAGNVARTTMGTVARTAGLGAAEGAVAGAGNAEEGSRLAGAGSGAAVGLGFGAATPLATRTAKTGYKWARDRVAPGASYVEKRAGEVMLDKLAEETLDPTDVMRMMNRDRSMRVPSVVANANPALVELAETVASRSGKAARKVEGKLRDQKRGARERTYAQIKDPLRPSNYYDEVDRMTSELRGRAGRLYDNAYAFGDVDDPRITEILKHPDFQSYYAKARQIADTEKLAAKLRGEDTSRFELPEIYKPSGKFDEAGNELLELVRLPDVRTLDYIKRGIDSTIKSGFQGEGTRVADASALRQLRTEFVKAIDEATGGDKSPYRLARQTYAGDLEVLDALEAGRNQFGKMDHEEVLRSVAKMSDAEKEAFRTGVVRNLYAGIMGTAQERNAAKNIIGSPEMAAKLQPLFDNPGHFRLFKAALERESQLFEQANQILANSRTAKRQDMRAKFEGAGAGAGEAVATALGGGTLWSSLTSLAGRAARNAQMSEEIADKLADMLMARDPRQVAAVVRTLERLAQERRPQALRAGATEYGITGGAAGSWFPDPVDPAAVEATNLEKDAAESFKIPEGLPPGPDIEEDIRRADEEEKRRTQR